MASRTDAVEVHVTAAGCVGAVGYDLATACASARAGIVRAAQRPDYKVAGIDGAAGGEALTVHAADVLTHGFEGPPRLLRLARAALADLARSRPAAASDRVTGLYLSLPPGGAGADAVVSARAEAGVPAGSEEERFAMAFAAALIEEWPWEERRPHLRFATALGHAGTAVAMQQALRDLRSGVVAEAIVGAVDSLLDEEALNLFEEQGRLKSSTNPAGLQPGEAAAVLALSREADVRAPTAFGRVETVELAEDATPLLGEDPPSGIATADVLVRCFAMSAGGRPIWVLSDQNGELQRARDWGSALVRLAANAPALATPVVWYPAMSFGDTRAASGAVASCLALEAFRRGYAPAGVGAILSSSDGATRAAILLKGR